MTDAHPTRTQYVIEVLRERLLGGAIAAGEPLRQVPLARELGVSQIPVREALLRLAAEGLVDFVPHRGAVASAWSVDELRELIHLRLLIETDLLRAAIPRMERAHFKAAEGIRAELDALLAAGQDIARWSELNQAFHLALYRAAQRPLSLDLARGLHRRADRYIRVQLLHTDWIPTARSEHTDLLSLCRRRRVDAAASLLARHIRRAGTALLERLGDR